MERQAPAEGVEEVSEAGSKLYDLRGHASWHLLVATRASAVLRAPPDPLFSVERAAVVRGLQEAYERVAAEQLPFPGRPPFGPFSAWLFACVPLPFTRRGRDAPWPYVPDRAMLALRLAAARGGLLPVPAPESDAASLSVASEGAASGGGAQGDSSSVANARAAISTDDAPFEYPLVSELEVPFSQDAFDHLREEDLDVRRLREGLLVELPAQAKVRGAARANANCLRQWGDRAAESLRRIAPTLGAERAALDEAHAMLRATQRMAADRRARADELASQLAHLRDNGPRVWDNLLAPRLDAVCRTMAAAVVAGVERLRSMRREDERGGEEEEKDLVRMEEADEGRTWVLTVRGQSVSVRASHGRKLCHLYRMHSAACDPEARHLAASLFVMLRRYQDVMGDNAETGQAHAAVPETGFAAMRALLGVEMESFASPLNCYFARFCSAHVDVDAPFGSLGSFYSFCPTEGMFEANPPFTTSDFKRTAEHILALLERADRAGRALGFVVVVPDWKDPEPYGMQLMGGSRFLPCPEADFVIPPYQHSFVVGAQHSRGASRYYLVNHGMRYFVLQTPHVAGPHAATPARLASLRQALTASPQPHDPRQAPHAGPPPPPGWR